MNLWQLTDEVSKIEDALDTLVDQGTEEEYLQAVRNYLDDQKEQLETKIDNYASLYRKFSAMGEQAMTESKRMAEIGRQRLVAAERLKATLLNWMVANEKQKVETTINKLRFQANGGVLPLVITEGVTVDNVPDGFVKVETTVTKSINTETLRTAIEAGACPTLEDGTPVAKIGERGVHLRGL